MAESELDIFLDRGSHGNRDWFIGAWLSFFPERTPGKGKREQDYSGGCPLTGNHQGYPYRTKRQALYHDKAERDDQALQALAG